MLFIFYVLLQCVNFLRENKNNSRSNSKKNINELIFLAQLKNMYDDDDAAAIGARFEK